MKKVITNGYSMSSNSSGFNAILLKFYEIICDIVVSKTVCGIFWVFCQSSFVNNFMEKSNFLESQNYRKLNIWKPIYFQKNFAYRFEERICTKKLDGFFFRKTFFSRTWSFFHDWRTTNLGVIFFHKKLILYFFSKVII